ncbi:MAG: hypothetical protein ACYTFO_07820, partial [Planctomycetota bacterium]
MNELRNKVLSLGRRARWRGRLRRGIIGAAAGVAGVSVLAAAAGIGWILSPLSDLPSGWTLPSIWAAGAAIGALVGMLRPVGVLAEEARIDRQRHSKDRLATAVELARSDRADQPAAEACYRQAAQAVGPVRAMDGDTLRAGRSWLAAAGLAALLSVSVHVFAYEITRPALASLNASQREALAGALQEQAAVIGAEELRRALADAAIHIEADNERAFQEAIAELRRQGFRPAELTPEAVRAAGVLMRSEQAGVTDPDRPPTPAVG